MNGFDSPPRDGERGSVPSSTPSRPVAPTFSPQNVSENLSSISPVTPLQLSNNASALKSVRFSTSEVSVKEISVTDVSDKLENDESEFATYLKSCLAYSKHLQPVDLLPIGLPSSTTSDSIYTDYSLADICNFVKNSVEKDVLMLVDYREVCPDVIDAQADNVFLEKIGEEIPIDRQKLFKPVLDSDLVISSYSSFERIAETKFAILYKCQHRITGILHCIKHSLTGPKDRNLCAREVLNEASALALTDHFNIVRYYDSWHESGSMFVAMEYCFGGSLFNFLYPKRNQFSLLSNHDSSEFGASDESFKCAQPLNAAGLSWLIRSIASALNYLHTELKYVHGDVKPSNILIQLPESSIARVSVSNELSAEAKEVCYSILRSNNPKGIVFKLSDFGRATRIGEDREGEDLGDGRYLPHLDDSSSPDLVTCGRDIYALGVTLYHAAGGCISPSNLERFRYGGFNSKDAAVLPTPFQKLVIWMLSHKAKDRPSAMELLQLLGSVD